MTCPAPSAPSESTPPPRPGFWRVRWRAWAASVHLDRTASCQTDRGPPGPPRSDDALLEDDLVRQAFAFLAGAHVDGELPAARHIEYHAFGAIAAIARRHDGRLGLHAPLLLRHLRLDRHQLGRIAVLGADVEQQRERLADPQSPRLGTEGDHGKAREHHPAWSTSQISPT